jgi:hypothetical protein
VIVRSVFRVDCALSVSRFGLCAFGVLETDMTLRTFYVTPSCVASQPSACYILRFAVSYWFDSVVVLTFTIGFV